MSVESGGQEWEEYRCSQKQRRRVRLARRTNEILELKRAGFSVEEKTVYQFRIDGVLDIYPVHYRYHDMISGERGSFKNIKRFVFERLRNGKG